MNSVDKRNHLKLGHMVVLRLVVDTADMLDAFSKILKIVFVDRFLQ